MTPIGMLGAAVLGAIAVASATAHAAGQAVPGGAAPAAAATPALTVYAAGSLRGALTQIAADFEAAGGGTVRLVFGPSGLLRDRLRGKPEATPPVAPEAADLFASANLEHPQSLATTGRAQRVVPFTRSAMCALASPAFAADGRPLVAKLLDPAIKVGTSTPKADPSGDYAFMIFDKIEGTGTAGAGSAQQLKTKALQLTGGPTSPPPPAGRNVYGVLVAQGQADVFLTYCTNATEALKQQPTLQSLPVPDAINVSATYGLGVMQGANAASTRFTEHLLGAAGQARLRALGFSAP